MSEFNAYVMTIPFLLNILQETPSSATTTTSDTDLSSSVYALQLNQLKQKIIDAKLIEKIFASLNTHEKISEFLKEKDVNHLLCFLGNFCSLSKLEFACLRANIDIFIVSRIVFVFRRKIRVLLTKKVFFVWNVKTISTQMFEYSYQVIYGKAKSSTHKANSNVDSIRWHPIFGFLKFKTCFG